MRIFRILGEEWLWFGTHLQFFLSYSQFWPGLRMQAHEPYIARLTCSICQSRILIRKISQIWLASIEVVKLTLIDACCAPQGNLGLIV